MDNNTNTNIPLSSSSSSGMKMDPIKMLYCGLILAVVITLGYLVYKIYKVVTEVKTAVGTGDLSKYVKSSSVDQQLKDLDQPIMISSIAAGALFVLAVVQMYKEKKFKISTMTSMFKQDNCKVCCAIVAFITLAFNGFVYFMKEKIITNAMMNGYIAVYGGAGLFIWASLSFIWCAWNTYKSMMSKN